MALTFVETLFEATFTGIETKGVTLKQTHHQPLHGEGEKRVQLHDLKVRPFGCFHLHVIPPVPNVDDHIVLGAD